MTKTVTQYLRFIDELLLSKENINFEVEAQKHLTKIAFFQHERLAQLIIMVLFSVLTVISFLYGLTEWKVQIITVMFLCLTALYIRHYFYLENAVQKM
ncbi:MAG: hypothetical protein RSA79_00610 [Oscillospiraceae bacterium]